MTDFITEDGVKKHTGNETMGSEDDLNSAVAENIKKYLDSWEMEIIFYIDMYNYNHSYTAKTFKFKEKDVVIKNGELKGFYFYGRFISTLDVNQEKEAPELIAEMVGEPTCRYYSYRVLMKLIHKP
ncbi:MAG: hypothetical protein J6Q94_09000 [Clostridia bacterium]|nr:hypothetical protein [Clostridia bacterium]